MLTQRYRNRFDHDIVERYFHWAYFVDALARFDGLVHVDLHGKVEVRCGKLALRQATGNSFAHLRYRHFFEAFLTYYLRQRYGRCSLTRFTSGRQLLQHRA